MSILCSQCCPSFTVRFDSWELAIDYSLRGQQSILTEKTENPVAAFESECCSARLGGLSYSLAPGEQYLMTTATVREKLLFYLVDVHTLPGCKLVSPISLQLKVPLLTTETSFTSIYLEILSRLSFSGLVYGEAGSDSSQDWRDHIHCRISGERSALHCSYNEVKLSADEVNLEREKTRDRAVIVKSENDKELSVVVFEEECTLRRIPSGLCHINFVGHCLATKVFIGKLPVFRGVQVIIGLCHH